MDARAKFGNSGSNRSSRYSRHSLCDGRLPADGGRGNRQNPTLAGVLPKKFTIELNFLISNGPTFITINLYN